MDHEGYVEIDIIVAGLKIKWTALTEPEKKIISEPEMSFLIAATMTDRHARMTTWHSFDPESINQLLEEMTKTTLYTDNIATTSLTECYAQCRELIINSLPTHIRAERDHAPTLRGNGHLHPRNTYDHCINSTNLQQSLASGRITKNVHYGMASHSADGSEQPLDSIVKHGVLPGVRRLSISFISMPSSLTRIKGS